MQDINFFAPYKRSKKTEEENIKSSKKTLVITSSILGVMIAGSCALSLKQIYTLKNQIEDYNVKLSDATLQRNIKESEVVNNKLNILNRYDKSLTDLASTMDNRDAVSNEILDEISSVIPSDIYYNSMSISTDYIVIQAVSNSRQAIGEIEHNIRNLSRVADVYINSISSTNAIEGQYSFDVKITLKGAK